jgi:peptide deformylase
MLKIINVPDPILREKSKDVKSIDKQTTDFVTQLIDTLVNKTDPPGVGLSAIQVGNPLRIFVTYLPKDKSLPASKWNKDNLVPEVYINPKITKTSKKLTLGGSSKNRPSLEGCLSIPHLYGPVERHEWIELEYQTYNLKESESKTQNSKLKTQRFSSFSSRVIQHEYDHLEGVLFTDHNQSQNLPLYFEAGGELQEVKNPTQIIKW